MTVGKTAERSQGRTEAKALPFRQSEGVAAHHPLERSTDAGERDSKSQPGGALTATAAELRSEAARASVADPGVVMDVRYDLLH